MKNPAYAGFFQRVEKPIVGAGAFDSPFVKVTVSPEKANNYKVLPPGRRGRRPLHFEMQTFLTD
jgi:hypothetical protein